MDEKWWVIIVLLFIAIFLMVSCWCLRNKVKDLERTSVGVERVDNIANTYATQAELEGLQRQVRHHLRRHLTDNTTDKGGE